MTNRFGQLAFIIILAAIPLFVFYDIGTRFAAEDVDTGSAENNAAMYPRLVAILMTVLLAIQAFRSLTHLSTDEIKLNLEEFFRVHGRAITTFFLFLLYIWGFRWFGFIYSTPIFLFLTQLVLGYRNPVGLVIYSGGVTAAVYYAFAKILNLALPAGDFFG